MYIDPTIECKTINFGMIRKNYTPETAPEEIQWIIGLYDYSKSPETVGVVSFHSVLRKDCLELLKDQRGSNSFIMIDWSELEDGFFLGDSTENCAINYNYCTDLNNFPIIKQYIENINLETLQENQSKQILDIQSTLTQYNSLERSARKVLYRSIWANPNIENGEKYENDMKLADSFIKELYVSDDVLSEFEDPTYLILGDIRHNYNNGYVNQWLVQLYDSSSPTIKSSVLFQSVNKKDSLDIMTSKNSYIVVDWSVLSDTNRILGNISDSFKLNIPYISDIDNFPIIKQYIENQNLSNEINISELFKDQFNIPAISWVDDDFNLSAVPKIKALCDEVGCKCDFGLVPSTSSPNTIDYDAVYSISENSLNLAKSYELEGFHIEMHPVHYGWYSTAGGEYSGRKWVENSLIKTIRVFRENGLINSSCVIYPGSSGGNSEVLEMTSNWLEFGINAGGKNGINDGICNKYSLNRIFIEFSEEHTKTWYKNLIDQAVSQNSWLIFGTHSSQFDDSGTIDETTKSFANLKELIQYANNKCKLKPISQVFRERKSMLEFYRG